MTFTTSCFVRVENPEKRKELIEWLEGIGYTHFPFIHDSCLIATDSDGRIWLTDANRDGAYDCQTNTDLFKALAAMNYENNREQWFVEEGKCSSARQTRSTTIPITGLPPAKPPPKRLSNTSKIKRDENT